jgi:preprotein translocase subunit SecF
MLIYITWRFEFRYALGGIIALVHDVLIIIGTVSIFNIEFTLSILAAVFFIIGFSINDTIVVLDRVGDIINMSVNQTLSRTILTSLTVFLTVLALWKFGGAVIHDFAFSLLVGVVFGTYSSVFISCPIVLLFENLQISKMKRKK